MDAGAGLVRSGERWALILTQPFKAMRRRIDRWIFTRLKRVPGPVEISRRRVYILPTRYGYGFGLLLLVMLLGSMNYSNSMAFALTFLLAGLGLVSMHHTHANLVNIQVRSGRIQPTFAGEPARFILELENPAPAARYALQAGWSDQTPLCSTDVPAQQGGTVTTPAAGAATRLAAGSALLGPHRIPAGPVPRLDLDRAGHGLPGLSQTSRRAARTPRPPPAGGLGPRAGLRPGQEEFAGLRSYQRGDAMRSIHWKSMSKLQTPQVKVFAETLEQELWLDWSALPPGWDAERRLSQLVRWVLDAESEGRSYGLRLPEFTQAQGQGELHRHECLRALALYQAPR